MNGRLDNLVGDLLGSVDARLGELDDLPERHLQSELDLYIGREPSRETEFLSYFASERRSGVVGSTVVPMPSLETQRVETLCRLLEPMGGPAAAFQRLHSCLQIIEEHNELYGDQMYYSTWFPEWKRAFEAYQSDGLHALEAADDAYESWRRSRLPEARAIGTTIGEDVLLSMADITALTGTTEDAARRLMREKGIRVYRIGKRKFVKGDDLLDATEDEPDPS